MKFIVENLALLSIFAIAIGGVYLSAYYGTFGIDIAPYIELSEIFQLKFNIILLTSLSVIYFIMYFIIIASNGKSKMFSAMNVKRIIASYSPLKYNLFMLIMIAGVPLLFFVSFQKLGSYEAQKILHGKSISEVYLIINEDKIKTDRNLLYVGSTKNYIIFYDKHLESTMIFKASDIKQINYSKGLDYNKQ